MYMIISIYLLMSSILFFLTAMLFIIKNIKIMMMWNLINLNSWKIEFIIYTDWMSMIFLSVVMLISAMVLIYSMDYMKSHIKINQFMKLIIIFFMSMMLMILSPNMISILLGWDGLGLSSYCLIIFYQNKKSFNSGMTTIMMNRIGDISILITISLILNKNHLNLILMNNNNMMMSMLIILTAMTKSAQIPFSTWLPLAMAAPTPVSSLVHSSTLVTAGVYMIIRFLPVIPNNMLNIIMIMASWTLIMASTSATFEYDMKKIIALSTLSQLSLMFITISNKLPNVTFFHLITHAMFKSLLFMCSGVIIHNYMNNQDIRFISTSSYYPLTTLMFNSASLALCGLPFLSGFYSKDMIIEMLMMNQMNLTMFYIMYMSMLLTTTYSFRLIFFISIKPLKMNMMFKSNMNNLMNNSMYILFFMTIFYGSIINWMIFNSTNMIFLPKIKKTLIFILILMNLIIIFKMSKIKLSLHFQLLMKMIMFFNSMWMMQSLMKKKTNFMFNLNNKLIMIKDHGWLEMLSSKKMFYLIMKMNKKNNKMKMYLILTSLSYILIMYMIY